MKLPEPKKSCKTICEKSEQKADGKDGNETDFQPGQQKKNGNESLCPAYLPVDERRVVC